MAFLPCTREFINKSGGLFASTDNNRNFAHTHYPFSKGFSLLPIAIGTLTQLAIFCPLFFFTSCSRDPEVPPILAPKGFPAMKIPEDNPITKEKIALGKKLFFDPILSADSSISCGSCHKPELAFSDGLALSQGINQLTTSRNSPSLQNVGYLEKFFRDGAAKTLELQVLAPIVAHNELGSTLEQVIHKLSRNKIYDSLFNRVFNKAPDLFGLTRAIACYERSLISGNSRFDQYYYQGNKNILSQAELQGMELFFSDKTKCSYCHSTFYLSNQEFVNIGLYQTYTDSGRARVTGLQEDLGKFRVPSLRFLNLTAPYMHNGSKTNLYDVIKHYEKGGEPHPNKHPFITSFTLTEKERSNLVAFLLTL